MDNNMEYYRERKKGIIGTVVFHTIILLILIFLGFFTPLPLPGEEGILVNFGNSDNGLGDKEPSPAKKTPTPAPQKKEPEKQVTPPPTTPPPSISQPKPEPKTAEEVAMTQDYEKTAAIEAAEKKKKEEAKKRQEEINKEKRRLEDAERIRLQEIERQKQAEIERQKQAEIERQRQAEAERKKREEEQKRISEINSRAQGAFGSSSSGNGGEGSSDGKSQGATFPGGNQGVSTGDPNAGNYGQGGSGSGSQGSGPSFNLSGRSAKSLPRPNYPGNDEGIVVVKITVNQSGAVTAAEPGVRGTTIMNKQFWTEAKQAALKAKFNIDNNASAFQQGTILYRFVLD